MMYLIGDGTVGPLCFLALESGVPPLVLLSAFSRFFKESFFSRCSRGAGFEGRDRAASGFSGDDMAGI